MCTLENTYHESRGQWACNAYMMLCHLTCVLECVMAFALRCATTTCDSKFELPYIVIILIIYPVFGLQSLSFHNMTSGDIPQLTLSRCGDEITLDFGVVKVGSCPTLTFNLKNECEQEHPTRVIGLPKLEERGIEIGRSLPVTVCPQGSAEIPIRWRPKESGVLKHYIQLQGAFGKAKVALHGKAEGPKQGKVVESTVARYRRETAAPKLGRRTQPSRGLQDRPSTPFQQRDLNVPFERRASAGSSGVCSPGMFVSCMRGSLSHFVIHEKLVRAMSEGGNMWS